MTKRIGFAGLGNMGLPMAEQLLAAGRKVCAFDVVEGSVQKAVACGATAAASLGRDLADGADTIITMLPASAHVRERLSWPRGPDRTGGTWHLADRLFYDRRGDLPGDR